MVLTERVERLESIEEIKVLKARYFRYVDEKRWDDLAKLFTDPAQFRFPGLGAFDDLHEGIAAVRGALDQATTVHHGHTPEIVVESANRATGIWAMHDYVIWPDAADKIDYPDEFQKGLRGYGHYHEEYRRIDGEWRIKSLALTRLHLEPIA